MRNRRGTYTRAEVAAATQVGATPFSINDACDGTGDTVAAVRESASGTLNYGARRLRKSGRTFLTPRQFPVTAPAESRGPSAESRC